MRVSQLDNYTNPNPLYNTPHFVAWGLATRLQRIGWHNLKQRFLPPKIYAILVKPIDMQLEPEEPFTPEMFKAGGFLHEAQLNHYIIFDKPKFMINVGYLWHHFAISDALGYAEFARMQRIWKENEKTAPNSIDSSEGCSAEIQAESAQNE